MRASLLACTLLLACGDPGDATSAAASTSTTATTSSTSAPSTSTTFTTDPTTDPTSGPTSTATTDASTSTGTTGTPDTTSTPDTTGQPAAPVPLRVLAINVGNASIQYGCFEYKLCRPQDIERLRQYIDTWRPDVILLSEVLRSAQLEEFLPPGYAGVCGESRDRHTGEPAAWDADDASHEHECVAFDTARLSLVEGTARSAPGRNDDYGQQSCNYDFTGFAADLLVDGLHLLTAVAIHPDSQDAGCRTEEISRYWSELATGDWLVIGGDWNTDDDAELQAPPDVAVAYLRGQHWDIVFHDDEFSAEYGFGLKKERFDHAFVRGPATPRTDALEFGSALGGHDDHPRADGGEGMDHRQILFDLTFQP